MFQSKLLLLLCIISFPANISSQPFNSDKILDTTGIFLENQPDGDIAVSEDGLLGIVWIDYVKPWENVWINILSFVKSSDHGNTFEKTIIDSGVNMAGNQFYMGNPKLHIDKTGNIWIAENYAFEALPGVSILKSTDNGETFQSFHPQGLFLSCLSLTSDTVGNVFMLFKGFSESYLKILKFRNGSLTDTISTVIITPGSSIYPATLVTEKNVNNIYVVFQAYSTNSKIFLAKSGDGGLTFSSPAQIDSTLQSTVNQRYAAAAFWNNKLCVSWSDNRNGEYNLYYSESADFGNTFSPAVQISNGLNGSAGISILSANYGMINILWQSSSNSSDIYYANKTTGSDTFTVPIKAGDPVFHNSYQYPLGIASDSQGYTYILFQDDRIDYEYTRIFLSSEKFALSSTDIKDDNPIDFRLLQNYPNPFNPSTTIKYSVPRITRVVIKIYDILGSEIEILLQDEKPAGNYEITWNAADKPSGVYFVRMQAGQFNETRKLILMK